MKTASDGKFLAVARGMSSGSYSSLRLWDVQTGKIVKTLAKSTVNEVTFSPDGKTLFASGKNFIRSWDVSSGKLKRSFSHPSVESLAISSDGSLLASTSSSKNSFGGILRIWNTQTGQLLRTLKPRWYVPSSVAFLPNSQTLIVGGGNLPNRDGKTLVDEGNSVVLFYNAITGAVRSRLIVPKGGVINEVVISPKGTTLVTNEYGDGAGKNAVKLWRIK